MGSQVKMFDYFFGSDARSIPILKTLLSINNNTITEFIIGSCSAFPLYVGVATICGEIDLFKLLNITAIIT